MDALVVVRHARTSDIAVEAGVSTQRRRLKDIIRRA